MSKEMQSRMLGSDSNSYGLWDPSRMLFPQIDSYLAARPHKLSCCSNCCQWVKRGCGCPYEIPVEISGIPRQKSDEPPGSIDVPCDCWPTAVKLCLPCCLPMPTLKIPSQQLMTQSKYSCNCCSPNHIRLDLPSGAHVRLYDLPGRPIQAFGPGNETAPIMSTGFIPECGCPTRGCYGLYLFCKCQLVHNTYRRRRGLLRAAQAIHKHVFIEGADSLDLRNPQPVAFIDTKSVMGCCRAPKYSTPSSNGVEVQTYHARWQSSMSKEERQVVLGALFLTLAAHEGVGGNMCPHACQPHIAVKECLCNKAIHPEETMFWDDSDNEDDGATYGHNSSMKKPQEADML